MDAENNYAPLGQDEEDEDMVDEKEEGEPVDSEPRDRTGEQHVTRGTVANFTAIQTALVDKIQASGSSLKKEFCKLLVENKRQSYYELNYNAEQVYEEMERLIAMDAQDIIKEILPKEDIAGPAKKPQRAVSRKRASSTEATRLSDNEMEEVDEHDANNPAPKQPKNSVGLTDGQRSLSSMWESQPTSQKTNKHQDGKEQ